MHQITYYHLILRYYGVSSYISHCHLHNSLNDLYDFLMRVDVEDVPEGHNHG